MFLKRYDFVEFDAEVQKERIKAQEALTVLEEIKDMVNEAIAKANETQSVLRDAESNAIAAKDIAIQAQVSTRYFSMKFNSPNTKQATRTIIFSTHRTMRTRRAQTLI